MALRVLLADESTTIKKVMLLALQDFAVEVKAVHAGVDVLDVARSFQPDIIFVDVLLQKKNGYEVCGMLKADAGLKATPVVLMWSSFMDLDSQQAQNSGADARLEKPFDVETLRKQVLELVPKSRSQRLAHFLDYSPKLNEDLRAENGGAKPAAAQPAAPTPPARPQVPPPAQMREKQNPAIPMPPPKATAPAPAPTHVPEENNWGLESFSDPSTFADDPNEASDAESFQPLELSQLDRPSEPPPFRADVASHTISHSATPNLSSDDESWTRQDLSRFKLDLPPISVGEGHEEFKIDMGEREFSQPGFQLQSEPTAANREAHEPSYGPDLTLDADEINNAHEEIAMPIEPFGLEATAPTIPQLSADRLEEIIRAQSREIIESVVRKMVPEMASTMIREELERLLEEPRT